MNELDIAKKQMEEKQKEVHGLQIRVKELSDENRELKAKLKNAQSDFGYDLVVENPDATHILMDIKDE
tara:strand:- start:235 stop:438 length:204 start_codon:yes stop_codon:yes gene_type:complete